MCCEHLAAICFSAFHLGVSRVFKKWPVLLADGGRKGRVGLSKRPVSALTHSSWWFSNAKNGGETQLGFLGGGGRRTKSGFPSVTASAQVWKLFPGRHRSLVANSSHEGC